MDKDSVKSIMEMARGAIMERVDIEMTRIIENIMDENTEAKVQRVLTLKVGLTPDPERKMVNVVAQANSKLAPLVGVSTALRVGVSGGKVYAVEMGAEEPGQLSFSGEEEPQPARLKLA